MNKDVFELTNPQKSIWVTEQFYRGSSINNICGTAIIEEEIDFNLLEKAINLVMQNHNNFRLKFIVKNGIPMQYLADSITSKINIVDVSNIQELENYREKILSVPFNLNDSFLFNFYIFKFPNKAGAFMLNIHHLIADAWTLGFISNEIVKIYSQLKNNTYEKETDIPSYVDYIYSEKKYIESEKFQKDKSYWENLYAEIPQIASIPGSNSQTHNLNSYKGNRKQYTLNKKLIDKINSFCKQRKASVFNFFMAILGIYIGRVSNLDEFVIGTPILNRCNFREKNTPGMFINTMPFKISLKDKISFDNFLTDISKQSLEMLRHQKYPYQNLLEFLRTKNPNIPNLYTTLFSYQITNAKNNESNLSYTTQWTFNGNCADPLAIHLYDINDIGSLNICYDYQTEIYTEKDIEEIHNRILYIIDQILKNSQILLSNIDVVTPEEKEELVYTFNDTKINYDKTIPIIKYFEKQAEEHPKDIALVFEKATMTYGMLNERANSLAHLLREKGITNNSIVGIMENRSFEMIVAILAVLKSGGSYIPIDPDYPSSRIEYMLEDSKASLLLSEKSLKNRVNFDKEIIYITLSNKEIYSKNTRNLDNISKPNDLSYIIYTSGSTGKPKGVMLTQKNLSNFYHSMVENIEYLSDGKIHKILSITTLSFDIFLFESLISLTRGLQVYITNYYEQKITSKLERLIKENKIEIMQTTPSVMRFHLDNISDKESFSNLKYVMLAGEQLPKKLVDSIKEVSPNCTIYNGYGPSETTIFSSTMNVTNLEKISIGIPIGNTQIYILDKNLCVLPKGSVGEIYISGDGVGKGYLYKDEMTKEKYLPNPFIKNSIMYKTGDLGLWLENGYLECRGRIDNQIKLHGLRIELGEIEEKINSFKDDNLLKSAVIVKNTNGKDTLNAFISYPEKVDISSLKKYLLLHLPNYMMPNTFTFVDNLPLTPNGKIDRKELQNYEINTENTESNISAPRNLTEQILVKTISKKLNAPDFGIDSNIFDFGADSLSIINILTELFHYNFNLKVYDLYKYPTVRELYEHLLNENELRKNLDLDKLIKLNDVVKNFSKDTNCTKIDTKYRVLLTGATGFLGSHILATLLDSPNKIEKIYCTMRIKNNIGTKQRLLNKMHFYFDTKYDNLMEKYVEIVEAQIPEENFGMNDDDYYKLTHSVDLAIHCAANVKHYGKYSDFEEINIVGTKNMVKFCKIANIPLHYISTMTVSGNYLLKQNDNSLIFDENSFYKNQKFDENVYAKSKLLAETSIIENMQSGLKATIYRIGDLTGRFTDGVFQENIDENSIYLRLRSILEIGHISKSILKNDLEFTPVDYAALAIKNIIWSNKNENRIFNIYNPHMISTESLIDFIKDAHYLVTVLSQDDFVNLIQTLSESEQNQEKLIGIINDFTSDNELVYNYTIKQNNDITCKYLKNLGFEWPVLDKQYIDKLLEYMKKVNFIK